LVVQKSGLKWEFLKELTIYECSLFYAEYINQKNLETYIQMSPHIDAKKKKKHQDIYYIDADYAKK
jgi:hypothetical protein